MSPCWHTFLHALRIFLRSYSEERPWMVVRVFLPFLCWIRMWTKPSWTSFSPPFAASAKGSEKKEKNTFESCLNTSMSLCLPTLSRLTIWLDIRLLLKKLWKFKDGLWRQTICGTRWKVQRRSSNFNARRKNSSSMNAAAFIYSNSSKTKSISDVFSEKTAICCLLLW